MPDDALEAIDARFRETLRWLRLRYGEVLRSDDLRNQLPGFKGQKGIYKPSGSGHALWVRETLKGPYPDQEPEVAPDGSWTYRYSPEGRGGRVDMTLDTNKALQKCMADGVPIGVLRQKQVGPRGAAYEILGLAYVDSFDGEHFLMRGEPIRWDEVKAETAQEEFVPFEQELAVQIQTRVVRDQRFGVAVRLAYREKCAACQIAFRVRGLSVGLDAAHIIPVTSRGTSSDIRNGMLLCRNHHALFDRYAWTVDEECRVLIADDKSFRSSATSNHILEWEGERLPNLPEKPALWPGQEAIKFRLDEFTAYWR